MKEILLGIDIGTSACKAAAFDPKGNVLSQVNVPYSVLYPHPGWAEQDPEAWWSSVCLAIRQVMEKGNIEPQHIAGIGIDGQSWSAIAVDHQGKVLCNTPIWMDTRADKICSQLNASMGEDRIFEVSGNPLSPSYTLPKVLWYRQELPQVYEKAEKILQSNSFLAFRLTGVMTQDPSQGYGWACYNMRQGTWDRELCREMGIRDSLLPEIVPCSQVIGGVTAEASQATGLLPGTPVVAGGLDAACGTLGAGVLHPGETQEQGGQAGGMSICIDEYAADKRLILSPHVVPGLWLLQGGTVGGGGVLNWFEREFGTAERLEAEKTGRSSFAEIDREASRVPAGSEGLVFLPYMAGERSPIWDVNAKGVYYGIDFSKTRAHFSRACMEGVAYSLRHNLETAKEAGAQAQTLRAMGGAANSSLWTQIKADVTGRKIQVPASDTATALGAALLAGVGTGIYPDFEAAVSQTVQVKREYLPDPQKQAVYDSGYETYLSIYDHLKELMNKEAIL